jgi:hypothetical protein
MEIIILLSADQENDEIKTSRKKNIQFCVEWWAYLLSTLFTFGRQICVRPNLTANLV